MQSPKVSVIVTTYNRANIVVETIDSILNQTFRDFELIIVDNESTDDTEKVVKAYTDGRIRYFKNGNNGIIAVNRNYGINRARGDYIAFCDDDDLWMPDKLEKQVTELERDRRIGLICANGINFDDLGNHGKRFRARLTDRDFSFESLLRNNFVSSFTAVVRKAVLDELGMLDESRELVSVEDYELWLRIAKKYKVKYIDLPLGKYRTHRGAYRKRGPVEELAGNRLVYEKLLEKGVLSRELYQRRVKKLDRRVWLMKRLIRFRVLGSVLLVARLLRPLRNAGRAVGQWREGSCRQKEAESDV